MKKILFLLLLSVTMYGQVPADATPLENIQITNNIQDNISDRVSVPTSDGVLNWKYSKDLIIPSKAFLSTGLLKNGAITINGDPTKFNITAGIGIISNFDDPANPTSTIINFPAFTGVTPTYLTTGNITYIAINSTPAVVMQATPFTAIQRRDLIELGAVIHSNLTTINVINNLSSPTNAGTNQLHDLFDFIGALNLSGNVYSANGANLQLNKSAGIIGKRGVNFINNWKDPHRLSQAGETALSFRYRTQNGTEGTDRINLDPALYDLNNVLTVVPNNKFTIQTVVMFQTGLTRILYGQTIYDDLQTAINAVLTRSFVIEPNSKENGIIRSYIIMRNTTTSLQNVADAKILEAQKFGGVASGGVALTLANIIAALNYTPEDVANKQNSLAVDGTNTKYPTVTAVNTGLGLKANLASPTFTGVPTAPTATAGTNTTQVATTAFVQSMQLGYAPNNDINYSVADNADSFTGASSYTAFPILLQLPNNNQVLFYKQATGHVGNDGVAAKKFSYDGGKTFTASQVAFLDPLYDIGITSGGVTKTGRIILTLKRYNATTSTSIDQGIVYSDDGGITFSTYTPFETNGHSFYAPYRYIVNIGDGKVMLSWHGNNGTSYTNYVKISGDNGATWGSSIAVQTSTSFGWDESSYAYLDGGVIIGLSRNATGSTSFRQVISTNNGSSWTDQGVVNFGVSGAVAPQLLPYIDGNGEKNIVCFYAQRLTGRKLLAIVASKASLIAGSTGWRLNSSTELGSNTIDDFGYQTFINPNMGMKMLGVFYKATSTLNSTLQFVNFTPKSYELSTYRNINVGEIAVFNRGIGTSLLFNTPTNVNRFSLGFETTESGANSGFNYTLRSHDDAGAFLRDNFIIERNTGKTKFGGALSASNSNIQDDSLGNIQSAYTGVSTTANSGYTAKNLNGTSQFMQWTNNGVRIGSRILTGGSGNVYITTGNDAVRMTFFDTGVTQIANLSGTGIRTVVADASGNLSATEQVFTGSSSLNFPSTPTGQSNELSFSVSGASDGDLVILGVPSVSENANSCYTARVSSVNTVAVKFNNYSASAIDPAIGTFKVKVLK